MRTLRIAGPAGDISVTRTGSGAEPSVVLLHPINTAGVVWHPVMQMLDRPTIAIDLRGHGRSSPGHPYTVEDGYVLDVLAVLDELQLPAVHLAGGSLGGTISLALAALHPQRVHSVLTLGSTLGTQVPAAAIDEMVRQLTAVGPQRYFADLVGQIVGPQYRDCPGLDDVARAAGGRPVDIVEAILRAAFSADIRHLADRVQAPVLAVGGTADPTCPVGMTIEIATRTNGSHLELDGVGHLPMLEVSERIAAVLGAHINSEQSQHR